LNNTIPPDLRYTQSHEWVRRLGDTRVEVGVTDHAQGALGDLVFVEVPAVARRVTAGESFAVVESVKAASDVYSPISGQVTAANTALADKPELVNEDPYGAGWLMRVELDAGAASTPLLTAAEYQQHLAELAGH
jgi:glycine cleavage system H protein